MQVKFMSLSNIFNSKLDNFFNKFNNKYIISCRQNKDITSLGLPIIEKNSVSSHTKIDEGPLKRNINASHIKIYENTSEMKRDTSYSEIKKRLVIQTRSCLIVVFFIKE